MKRPGDGFKAACWQGSRVVSVKVEEKVEVRGCAGKKGFVDMKGVSRRKQ